MQQSDVKYPAEIAGAINAVMGEVDYIQKKGENKFHGYKFTAVGDLLAKLQPSMAKHGLVIVQNELDHTLNGAVMEVRYEFTLVHKTGAVWPVRYVHTGMATATNTKGGFDDKCVNKCMTAARKYFLLALFQIPTGDDADADEDQATTAPAARANGNGAAKTAAPKQEADPLREAFTRIKTALAGAASIKVVDDILKLNERDLQAIREKSAAGYDQLMAAAETRRVHLDNNTLAA
jgi:hypothetical protein